MTEAHEIQNTLQEMVILQKRKVMQMAQDLGVHLTDEDILNPHDYPLLLKSHRFNYEDGFLAGLLAAQMALRSKI